MTCFSHPRFFSASVRALAMLLAGVALVAERLAASSYDYAYGSMAHYNERSREQAVDRMSNYSSNSSSRRSGPSAIDQVIAQMREAERAREERSNQPRYQGPAQSMGNNLLENFQKYKRLHPEEFRESQSPARDFNQEHVAATTRKANGGSVEAMFALAHYHHGGNYGLPKNNAAALFWFEKAGVAGNQDAVDWAYFMHRTGDGVPVNEGRSLFWQRKRADAGAVVAQRDIGARLLEGRGVPADVAVGIHYLELASAQGDLLARQRLIAAYADPKSSAHNLEKARGLLRVALGKPADSDFYDNIDWLLKVSAEAGLDKTQLTAELISVLGSVAPTSETTAFWLGALFQGRSGVQRDDLLAAKYFELSANLGSPYAPDVLIALYGDADSAAHSAVKALEHVRKQLGEQPDRYYARYLQQFRKFSTEAGIASAAAEADLRERLTFAVKTRAVAGYCLGQVIEDGPTRQPEAATIVALYRKAAEQSASECQAAAALRLYEIYAKGELVPADALLAAAYLQKADAANKEVALYLAGVKCRDGIGSAPEPVKAFFKFADLGYYDSPLSPVHELMRRAGLKILKAELAHSKEPAEVVAMLRQVRFGSFDSDLAVWSAEEEVRATVRFPDYYDQTEDDARSILRHAAENGHPDAFYWLAVSEARVLGPDESTLEYARKGAEAGNLACKNLLGLWRWETTEGKDLSCVPLLEEAVNGGVEDALFNLARVHEVGDAPVRDEVKARAFYAQAADVGIAAAKRQLGAMWAEGRGGVQDRAKGLALLREAAADDRGAAYLLGLHLLSGDWGERNEAAACDVLKSALSRGEWRAGIELAWTYHSGAGVPMDGAAARSFLQEAGVQARRDHAAFMDEADRQIGSAFWYGTCVAADFEEAVKWLPSGFESAVAYRTGQGAAQNLVAAVHGARRSEEWGEGRGVLELGEIALQGGRPAEARQYFERAAQAGSVRALEKLAESWSDNPSVAQLYKQAALQLAKRADAADTR